MLSFSAAISTPTLSPAFPYSDPSTFSADFHLVIPTLVGQSSRLASVPSTVPLGLLSHSGFRLETQIESAAAGYRNDAKGGRSSQEGGDV